MSKNVYFTLLKILINKAGISGEMPKPELIILKQEFSIHYLKNTDPIPARVFESEYYWIGKTNDELSIVCRSNIYIESMRSDLHWGAIKLSGQFNTTMVGVISEVAQVLASAGISIFILSTYNTDYVLIKNKNFNKAVEALKASGYSFI